MFTAEASARLGGAGWLRARRSEAFAAFAAMPLPSEKEEVWRYTPIEQLDLGDYAPVVPGGGFDGADPMMAAFVDGVSRDLAGMAALVVVRCGSIVSTSNARPVEGLSIGSPGAGGEPEPGGAALAGPGRPGLVLEGGDALVRLNDAFMPEMVTVDVAAGAHVEDPVVVVHWCHGAMDGENEDARPLAPASFPRTVVRVGRGGQGSVVEIVAGAPGGQRALAVPVTELEVADGAHLAYVSLQVLGDGAWCIGRLAARIGADAALRSFTVGLGGTYDRLRTDAAVVGRGGSSELHSAYLGTGDQVHDVRTLQDHAAPRTTSNLLCKGAVAGTSRSVYSGLIRIRPGAVRAEAMQTNHNLVLDAEAHADSVPNLDIEENDVRCSHASTIGPVDEDQRFYLESRGVAPERAEQLIVRGFFDDIVERAPVPAVVPRVRHEVNLRLADALGISGRAQDGAPGWAG